MKTVAALAAGLGLGTLASPSDYWAGGLPSHEGWLVVSIVTNSGSAWAAVAVLAGWLAVRQVWAPLAGVAGALRLWLVASVLLGPVLGWIGHLARRRDSIGSLGRLVLPVGLSTAGERS